MESEKNKSAPPLESRPLKAKPERTRVALPNHITYCDEGCRPEGCSETHKRREVVARIDADD